MDWPATIFQFIDMRSFSNLWYWIGLGVLWSSASHYILGVPFDMVGRARRMGGQAEEDFRDLLRIKTSRMIYIADEAGVWIVALGMFILTGCLLLGFVYGVEFAQAVFLLGCPMSLVSVLSLRVARRLHDSDTTMEEVYKRLSRHRLMIQFIGMLSIFITAMWGMYHNLSIGALSG